MQDFLKLSDLTTEEITGIIDLGIKLKDERKKGIPHRLLEGKTLGMIFTKSSTRTRVSFESGMLSLGGHAIFLSTNDIQLGRGESIADTARTLSRYLDIIMIRTFKQSDVEELAKFADIPVINGLTDYSHPTQALADYMAVKERYGKFDGLKICYIGDGNNVANSLIVGAVKLGMEISLACPLNYYPDEKIVEWAKKNGKISIFNNVKDAAKDADVLYTDVWASMGQEKEAEERKKIFKDYQINANALSYAHKGAMVLHCLPAHKDEEISNDTFEEHADEIFNQAENRLHIHKAIMVKLLK